MGTPLYTTDIIPLTSRPTLTVMDDGDYFAILDTSTGKISKILRTDVQKALSISYDNATSGLTATQVQAALDELVVNLGSSDNAISALAGRLDILEADDSTEGSVAKTVKDAVADLAGTGRTTETVKGNADAIALRELSANKVTAFQETPDDTHYPSEKLVDDSLKAIKGVDYTDGTLKSHEDRLDTLEGDVATEGSVAKTVKDAVDPIIEDVSDHESRLDTTELTLARQGQDLASVKQTLQQGNGATLDFSGIGSVALDARATGRANPTIYGSTVGSDSIQLPARVRSVGRNLIKTVQDVYRGADRYLYTMLDGRQCVRFTSGITVKNYPIQFLPSTQYSVTFEYQTRIRVSGGGAEYAFTFFYTDGTRSSIPVTGNVNTTEWAKKTLTSTAGKTVESIGVYTIDSRTYVYISEQGFQLEASSTPTTVEPYTDSTLYIADNEGVRSIQDVQDTLTMVNGEYIYTKKVSTPASVASGVAVNVTNYPTAKTGGKFAVELTAGGTQIGVIGTDSTSGAGTLRFELARPLTINLLTSGILQSKPKGTVYFEPYYEGSHQTDASSQITLPYEGTIEAVYGYDEDLVEYLLDSSEYSLTGTTLTITDALENEVFFVQMSRSEPLAPEMSVNVLNNEQVIADTSNGKFYKLVPTITNGELVSQTPVEVV